jgi:hypothetical protein
MSSIRSSLFEEIRDIVVTHLEELAKYIPGVKSLEDRTPEQILLCLERLSEICSYQSEDIQYERYLEVCDCQNTVQNFLKTMNQTLDGDFKETSIGQILTRATVWEQRAAKQFRLTKDEVWDFIAPVKPDHLEDLGNGQYEARWWKPVPVMDIEILMRTEGVLFQSEPFEPHNLAGGLAVRFSISADISAEI